MTDLPAGWRLETLAELTHGGVFSDGDWIESKDQDPSGSVRLTQLADVGVGVFRHRSDRWLREDQAARLGCTFLAPGDVLVARMPEPIGRACQVPTGLGRAVTAVDVAILRPVRDDVDPRYLMWAINSPRTHSQIAALQSGTTRKRVSRKNLATVRIPIPSLTEQRRIVDILEDHLSRLDAASSYLSAAARRASVLERSVLDRVIWGPEVPTVPVTSVLREPMRNGYSARASAAGTVRVLTLTAVTQREFSDRYTKLTDAPPERIRGLWLEPGDIFVQRANTPDLVGSAALYTGPSDWAVFPDLLIRLRANPTQVMPEYLALALQTERSHRILRARAKGLAGSMPKVDQAAVGELLVPCPPLPQQERAVADALGRQDAIGTLAEAARVAQRRESSLRRALLTAAFSGSLTGRSSDLDQVEERTSQDPELVS